MTFDIVLEALEAYEKASNYPDYKRRVIHDAIVKIASSRSIARGDLIDNWYGSVYVIPAASMLDILNLMTYDIYGKLARDANGNPSFNDYIKECRMMYGLEYLSIGALRAGFDYLSDLWRDNEAYGSNNPDGTFLKNA